LTEPHAQRCPCLQAATIKDVFFQAFKGNFYPFKVMFGVLAPYFTAHFIVTPGIFYALFGKAVALTALANLALAEVLTNIHSFIIVVPNHAGEDVYRFNTPVKVKSDEFYLRAVIGSVNFNTGSDLVDYPHGWLNYQIEHHMWPDMSMLAYQRAAPKVRDIPRDIPHEQT
jgi:fatty acid desaturase